MKDLFKRNNLKVNEDGGDDTLIPRNKQKNDETLGDEFSASLLWMYKKENTTVICGIYKHKEGLLEIKHTQREEIDAAQISFEACLDLKVWNVGTDNERSSQNRRWVQKAIEKNTRISK